MMLDEGVGLLPTQPVPDAVVSLRRLCILRVIAPLPKLSGTNSEVRPLLILFS